MLWPKNSFGVVMWLCALAATGSAATAARAIAATGKRLRQARARAVAGGCMSDLEDRGGRWGDDGADGATRKGESSLTRAERPERDGCRAMMGRFVDRSERI